MIKFVLYVFLLLLVIEDCEGRSEVIVLKRNDKILSPLGLVVTITPSLNPL